MPGKIREHLRSNVVAYLALFVALGGTGAYAANELKGGHVKKNSIKSKQIKDGQVKTADLADGAVNSAKVADGSLAGIDLALHSIATDQLAARAQPVSFFIRSTALAGGDRRTGSTYSGGEGGGVMCFGLTNDPVAGVASVEHSFDVSGSSTAQVKFAPSPSICPDPANGDAAVFTYDESGVAKDLSFFVIFY